MDSNVGVGHATVKHNSSSVVEVGSRGDAHTFATRQLRGGGLGS